MKHAKYKLKFQVTGAEITDTTEQTLKAAPGAGKAYRVTAITVSNMDATVATRVNVLDGAGGSILWSLPAAAIGGGAVQLFPEGEPLELSADKALVVVCEDNSAEVVVSAKGYTEYITSGV
jgi:hypothetical protein